MGKINGQAAEIRGQENPEAIDSNATAQAVTSVTRAAGKLSLGEMRLVTGTECTLSDSELAQLCEALYDLADIAVETYIESRRLQT